MVAHADRNALDEELGVVLDDALQQELGQFGGRHHREADVHDDALDQLLDVGDLGVVRADRRVVDVDLGDFVQQPGFNVAANRKEKKL